MLRVWFLLTALPLALGASSATAQSTLSFDQALARARTDAPSVQVAMAAVARTRAAEDRARGAYLPRLSAQVGATLGYTDLPITPDVRVSSTAFTASGSSTLEWTLLDFGARRGAFDSAQALAEASTESANATRRLALELAAEAYLRALAARDLVEDGRLTLSRRTEELSSIDALVTAGVRPAVDRQRAEIEVVAARYALEIRSVMQQAASATLAVTTGADPLQPVLPADAPGAALGTPMAVEEAVALAIAKRPEIKSAEAGVRSRAGEAKSARAQRWPNLAAQLNGTLAHTEVLDGFGVRGPTYLGSGGLVLRWNGLDATVWRQTEVADAAETEAERALGNALLSVRAEAVAAAYAVLQQKAALDRSEQMLGAARVMREAQLERYRAGVASMLELLDAEGIEQTARVNRIEAARDHDLARMRLLSVCGVLSKR